MTPEQIAKRYPWTKYERGVTCGPEVRKTPFRVGWTVPSAERLDYGWRSEIRLFADEASARAAAEAPMGVAKEVRLDRFHYGEDQTRIEELYRRKNPAYAHKRRVA